MSRVSGDIVEWILNGDPEPGKAYHVRDLLTHLERLGHPAWDRECREFKLAWQAARDHLLTTYQVGLTTRHGWRGKYVVSNPAQLRAAGRRQGRKAVRALERQVGQLAAATATGKPTPSGSAQRRLEAAERILCTVQMEQDKLRRKNPPTA